MCRSMVDIQSVMAEIRRGKKIEERNKKPQGKNIMPPLLHRAAIINHSEFLTVFSQYRTLTNHDVTSHVVLFVNTHVSV